VNGTKKERKKERKIPFGLFVIIFGGLGFLAVHTSSIIN
jgi:hypothetical protein